MPGAPPIGGAAASSDTPMGQAMAGGMPQQPGAGADAQRQGIEVLMGQIRDIGQQVEALQGDFPDLAPDVQQIMTLLKNIVVKAARSAPQQTASGAAVPGA